MIFTDLFIELIKSTSYFIMYFWEWLLMIGGLLIGLLAIYFCIFPNGAGLLLATFPNLDLDLLGIESQPVSWYNYPLNIVKDIFNYLNSFYYLKGLFAYLSTLTNISYYCLSSAFSIIFNSLYYFKVTIGYLISIFGYIVKSSAYLALLSVISGVVWVSIQMYVWTEEIVQMAIGFVAATPGLPRIFALGSSLFYLRIMDPVMGVIEAGGTGLDAILTLIPSEQQVMLWSAHIVNIVSINYQVAWGNAACAFIDFFHLPLHIGAYSLNITGGLAYHIIRFVNPVLGVGIPRMLDRIAAIFTSWV